MLAVSHPKYRSNSIASLHYFSDVSRVSSVRSRNFQTGCAYLDRIGVTSDSPDTPTSVE